MTTTVVAKETTDGFETIAAYWNGHIHDWAIATQPPGSLAFFEELDAYRFDKLQYLGALAERTGREGGKLLEVGCGIGIDLARIAAAGAEVTGIDLAARSIELAEQNFGHRGLDGTFAVMNGEQMTYDDDTFDTVYCHGVIQYTVSPAKMVAEIHRVLKPGGRMILMGFHKNSWLRFMSVTMGVPLEHVEAPFYRLFTVDEMRSMTSMFAESRLDFERFPVATKIHKGWKAFAYNSVFVPGFNLMPRFLTKRFGWHLLVYGRK